MPPTFIVGICGVHIEDDIVVTKTGVEALNKATKEL